MYGAGLRLLESCRLRIKDDDFPPDDDSGLVLAFALMMILCSCDD